MVTSKNKIKMNVEDEWELVMLEEEYSYANIKDPFMSGRKDVTTLTLKAASRPNDTPEWAQGIVAMYTNPVQDTMTYKQKQVHEWHRRLKRSYLGRVNSLGNDADDEVVNDPRKIVMLMLRADKGINCENNDAYNSELVLFNTRKTSGKFGLISLERPENRPLLRPNGRFGRDGGDLQDLWSALALLRTSGCLDLTMQGLANAMFYAKLEQHDYRMDRQEDR
tara:strand:+ start:164 stop:829 length:666 start_codon:yes stop_codon:yes gene_type:complete